MQPVTAVCFDLGGVLARLASSWAEALDWAGFAPSADPRHSAPVHSLDPYNSHELGELSDGAYLAALGDFLGLGTPEEAMRAHLWVLGQPYPGTHELVSALQRAGLRRVVPNTSRE